MTEQNRNRTTAWGKELAKELAEWMNTVGEYSRAQLANDIKLNERAVRRLFAGEVIGRDVSDSASYANLYILTELPQADPRTVPPRLYHKKGDSTPTEVRRAWNDEEYQIWRADGTIPTPVDKPVRQRSRPGRKPKSQRKPTAVIVPSEPTFSSLEDLNVEKIENEEVKDTQPASNTTQTVGQVAGSWLDMLINSLGQQVASKIPTVDTNQQVTNMLQHVIQLLLFQQQSIASMQQTLIQMSDRRANVDQEEILATIRRLLDRADEVKELLTNDNQIVLAASPNDYEKIRIVKQSMLALIVALKPFLDVKHPELRDYLIKVQGSLIGDLHVVMSILYAPRTQREAQLRDRMEIKL